MPRAELDAIQAKLKVAIQNHQNIVAKLKMDPQNVEYKSLLHNLQSQITSLSDQQRVIVQKLRQDLLEKDRKPDPFTCQPQPAHQQFRGPPAAHTGSPPITLHSPLAAIFGDPITPNPTPADLSVKSSRPVDERLDAPSTQSSHVVHKPTLLHKRLPNSPLRVPNVTSIKNVSSSQTQLDKPLYINTSPLISSPSEIKDEKPIVRPPVLPTCATKKPLSQRDRRKQEFMASMNLVTIESIKEIQAKRCERKRRSTANPELACRGEPEKKRIIYLMSPPGNKKAKARPNKPNSLANSTTCEANDATCCVCGTPPTNDVPLLHCDLCYSVYHQACVQPPLSQTPTSPWACPACEENRTYATLNADNLAIVHSFIASKAAREDEKRKLQKRGIDLVNEKILLERQSQELTECLNKHVQEKKELLAYNRNVEESMNNLKNFVKIFQS